MINILYYLITIAVEMTSINTTWMKDLRVIVDLTSMVTPGTVNRIIECIQKGKVFVIHNNKDELFYYNPVNKWGQWKNTSGAKTDFKFDSINALINSVKLQLITFHHLIVPNVLNPAAGPKIISSKRKRLCQ